MTREAQRFDRRTASPGRIAVGHDVDWDIGLLFALGRHTGTDLVDEPPLEVSAGFDRAPTNNQCVRVERIDHFVEE